MFITKRELANLKQTVLDLKYEIKQGNSFCTIKGRIEKLEDRMNAFDKKLELLMDHFNLHVAQLPAKQIIVKKGGPEIGD